MNRTGPSTDRWGTPQVEFLRQDRFSPHPHRVSPSLDVVLYDFHQLRGKSILTESPDYNGVRDAIELLRTVQGNERSRLVVSHLFGDVAMDFWRDG